VAMEFPESFYRIHDSSSKLFHIQIHCVLFID